MAVAYPGQNNTFVRDFESSGRLIVSFSRNPKTFALPKYIGITPVKRTAGYYMKRLWDEQARVLQTDSADFLWADGAVRPEGDTHIEGFEYLEFVCKRYANSFTLGQLAADQADHNIVAAHASDAASRAMVQRTQRVATVLQTTGNWGSSTDTAVNLGGNATWSGSAVSDKFIKKGLMAAAKIIHKATNGVVTWKDIMLVLNPVLAEKLARAPEIHEYIKESPFSMAQLRGDVESQNGIWGLPNELYGFKVVVEDAVKVTSKKGATRAEGFVFDDDKIVLCARPGALVGIEGSPTFNTMTLFAQEEMTVETLNDVNNRRVMGSVVDTVSEILTAPASGYLITAVG